MTFPIGAANPSKERVEGFHPPHPPSQPFLPTPLCQLRAVSMAQMLEYIECWVYLKDGVV